MIDSNWLWVSFIIGAALGSIVSDLANKRAAKKDTGCLTCKGPVNYPQDVLCLECLMDMHNITKDPVDRAAIKESYLKKRGTR